MRVFFIGFGQAGGKLVDMFLAQDRKLGSTNFRGIVINTARTDLLGIKNIPMVDRLLIGQTMVKGHGVGTDNVTGAKVAADEIDTIINAIDRRGTHDIDAFVVCAGLGGGTGSGGSPVLCRHLKRIYREPVYAVGVIPSPEEGRLYSLNAARSLSTLVNEADNVIVFDNSAWKNDGESVKSAYERLNEEIVRRFGVLFRAGEVSKYGVGEMVVDSSEIINTLRGGGISSVGYAISEAVPTMKGGKPVARKDTSGSLLSGIFGKKEKKMVEPRVDIASGEDKSAKIIGLVRRAMLGRLTLPCDYSTAERALVLVAGPPNELDRKGVEKSKSWVEENIAGVEVRGGDYPVDSGYVAAVVLLATIGDAPRIRELMEFAKEAREEVVKSRERSHTAMFEGGVDPLFE
ncbi:MAG: tubulin/FtsZ family protein [Methanocalculaceae archaeon]|nr:tubulin/FtsZ family protein [Methanocalculaceae archaeon]